MKLMTSSGDRVGIVWAKALPSWSTKSSPILLAQVVWSILVAVLIAVLSS